MHDGIECRLTLKSDAWPVRERDVAPLQPRVVRKPTEGAEYAGVRFRPAKSKPGGDGERHLIAAVREQGAARPAVPLEHGKGACVLHDAVGLRRIDLDHIVARRIQAAETHEVFGGAAIGEMDIAYRRVEGWLASPLTDTAFDTKFLEGTRLVEFRAKQFRLKLLSIVLHETNHLVFPHEAESAVRGRSLALYRDALVHYVETTISTLSLTIDQSSSRFG